MTGVSEGDRVGFLSERAFAEYDLAAEGALVKLPAALDGTDVPVEPFGCIMNIWRRCDIRPGHSVAIVGMGFLGAALARLSSVAGARVIAISRRPYSLELARRMGADTALTLSKDLDAVAEQVNSLTDGVGCDRVIEAVGLQDPLDLAGNICRVRGRLVIVGFHQDGRREVDLQLWNWRGLDVVNAHERDPHVYVEGMQAAVDVITRKLLDPAELITHRIPLEDAATAFELLRTRPSGFVKAVVVP